MTGSGTVDKLIVKLDMQHWFFNNLEISVWRVSDSRKVVLDTRNGCGDFDRRQFTYDGDALYFLGSAPGDWPCRGDSFLPHETLSSFSGASGNGQWKLQIKDVSSPAIGTLYSWCLRV